MSGAASEPSYGLFLLETVLILAAVCAGAWLLLRFGLGRLYSVGAARQRGPLKVVARLPLEPRRTLYLVEAGRKVLLVGAGAEGPLTTLAELDPADVATLPPEGQSPILKSFVDLLRRKTPSSSASPPRGD